MFVRERVRETKREGKIKYAYLVENRWNPVKKKYQQKIIQCLGRVDKLPTDGTIEKMIVALDRFASQKGFSSLSRGVVIDDLNQENIISKSYDFGEMFLVENLLKILSFTDIFKSVFDKTDKKRVSWDKFLTATTSLLSYHLHPQISVSERATYRWYKNQLFLKNKPNLSLMDFYRTLDVLIANKDTIEKQYFEKNKTLFSKSLDLILFDTTSIYYYDGEEKINDKSILQYGYSKDSQESLKQLIVGVLMSDEGVPIAHEVFKGNQSDLKSFKEIIQRVKDKYEIKRIIFVADRGMVSEENLSLIEEEGMEYILGVKMRKLSPVLKTSIFPIDTEFMEKVKDNLYVSDFSLSSLTPKEQDELIDNLYDNLDTRMQTKEEKQKLKDRILKRRLIICFNPLVAIDEKQKREYFKKIIANKIKFTQNKSWFVKNGYSKYVKINKLDISLNEDKLNQEALFDGVWILTTNCSDKISPQTVSLAYQSLQFVERGFRDLKSQISIRPIYHFKEERIKAHIFVAFLTLIVKWYILNTISSSFHEEGLRFIDSILSLKAIEVDKSISLYVRTEIDEETITRLGKLKIKIPPKILNDSRRKPVRPPSKPGRPKKVTPNQLTLT
jgi:transposase